MGARSGSLPGGNEDTAVTDEATHQEERLSDLLAACDEALAAGAAPIGPDGSTLPPELRSRLERGVAGMRLLRQVLPRSGGALPVPGAPLPRVLGHFEIRRELGRGAFGVVFLAHDPRLRRDVALKVPRPDALFTPDLRERFLREARAAAALDHPNIVTVHDAGTAGPVCYIASTYCSGPSLAGWIRLQEEAVPARQAARIVAALAQAVQHAHDRGIVHRDLKPGNVLLAPPAGGARPDTEPGENRLGFTPKVTDFGLAKVLAADPSTDGAHPHTQTGAIVGTPSYMAPEQAGGKGRQVGPAADIYALGAILYELLTGHPPFRGESALDTLEQVRCQEPTAPRRLRPRLPRDPETICLKALEKEPARRYASAAEMGADLERFLAGRAICARPSRFWQKGWKWSKRRPAIAGLILLLFLSAALGSAGVLWKWLEAEGAWRAEARQRTETQAALARLQESQYFRNIALAESACRASNFLQAEGFLNECPEVQRHWEWGYLKRLCLEDPRVVSVPGGSLRAAVFSRDGRLVATLSGEGTIQVWDTSTWHSRSVCSRHEGRTHAVTISPDGSRLASVGSDRLVRIWDVASGCQVRSLGVPSAHVLCLAYSPDGRYLACGSWWGGGGVQVWDANTFEPLFLLRGDQEVVTSLAFSPDGRMLATSSPDTVIRLWDLSTRTVLTSLRGHTRNVTNILFSPNGRYLATTTKNHVESDKSEVFLWDLTEQRVHCRLQGHSAPVQGIAFSPDSRRLVTASWDQSMKLWDCSSGQEALTLRGHNAAVNGARFSPDGNRLHSWGRDGVFRIWDAAPLADQTANRLVLELRGHTDGVYNLALDASGRRLISAGGAADRTLRVWDLPSGKPLHVLKGHEHLVQSVALAPDGSEAASVGWDGTLRFWDLDRGVEKRVIRPELNVAPHARSDGFRNFLFDVAYSKDGRSVLIGCEDGVMRLYSRDTGQLLRDLPGHEGFLFNVSISADGQKYASAGADQTVRIWDARSGRELLCYRGHRDRVTTVAFAWDGHSVFSASADGALRIWDQNTGQDTQLELRVGSRCVQPSVGGKLLATGSLDGTVRVLDGKSGRRLLTLRGHTDEVLYVLMTDDGRRLVSASADRTVKVWNIEGLDLRGVW
jgi:WD40 repeat protein/serine/threonine protein kinase